MTELEEHLQYTCYQWFHNTYPHLRGLLCCNLNNSRNAVQGNKNKAMGVQKGRADMTLYVSSARTCFIEFKAENGKQSEAQKEWQKLVESRGYRYFIIKTLEEFKSLIITLCSNV